VHVPDKCTDLSANMNVWTDGFIYDLTKAEVQAAVCRGGGRGRGSGRGRGGSGSGRGGGRGGGGVRQGGVKKKAGGNRPGKARRQATGRGR
jgi:hypothetical protein